jgi:hypothetical protein
MKDVVGKARVLLQEISYICLKGLCKAEKGATQRCLKSIYKVSLDDNHSWLAKVRYSGGAATLPASERFTHGRCGSYVNTIILLPIRPKHQQVQQSHNRSRRRSPVECCCCLCCQCCCCCCRVRVGWPGRRRPSRRSAPHCRVSPAFE